MNNENFEICKHCAEEIEKYYNRFYICPECGAKSETEEICPECGKNMEYDDIYSYFQKQEIYDIEYRIDGNGNYKNVRLMIACGGPTVYINTATASIELSWGNEKASYLLNYDVVDAINDYWEEDYNCLR